MAKKPTKTKPKADKAPKGAAAAEQMKAGPANTTDSDEENRKLFLNVHLPKVKELRAKLQTANSNLRNAYKTAKAEGSFTKADFDIAIQMEDAEKEARAAARIARQIVIGGYMGSTRMGRKDQLDLFLEPDRTPAADVAFDEGKMAAMQNKAAKPSYDPATEQYRKYMEGYHSVSEQRVTDGIKPLSKKAQAQADKRAELERAQAEKKAKDTAKAANQAQRDGDAQNFEETKPPITSGVPMSRAQFLAQQQQKAGEKPN